MDIGQFPHDAVGRHRFDIVVEADVLLCGVHAPGKRIAMIWLAAVRAPKTEESTCDHVQRMSGRNFTSDIIECQAAETEMRTFFVQQLQHLFPGQRNIVFTEASALDGYLSAREGR